MKLRPLLLSCFLSLITAHQVRADKNVLPFVNGKKAPVDVRAKMPRGARSVRFGTAKIGKNNAEVLLHLYELKHIGYLDILQRVGKAPRRRLVRLNSVRLDMNGPEGSFSTYWLDPQTRKAPIVLMEATDSGGFGSVWSLYVFPQGLQGRIVRQEFTISFSSSSDVLYYSIAEPDSRGFATVKEFVSPRTTTDYTPEQLEEASKQSKEVLRFWNGNGFIPAKQNTTQNPDDHHDTN